MRAALLHSKKVIDSQSSLSEGRKELLRGAIDTRNVEDKATYVYTKFTNLITRALPYPPPGLLRLFGILYSI